MGTSESESLSASRGGYMQDQSEPDEEDLTPAPSRSHQENGSCLNLDLFFTYFTYFI